MKPIKITKQDQFGCERTFAIRPCESGVSLAEIDSETAALDHIKMLIQSI